MKILLVAGARPNFMKIASIIDALHLYNRSSAHPLQHVLVHTGQHYDASMSQAFFRDLGLPQPDVDLGVGSASHAQQTAAIVTRFEPVLMREQPDVVVVVGDVNSTMACALVAAKITYPPRLGHRSKPLIAHVEAGLRSFDRSMPEEINRILTDAIADLLFLTEESAEANLLREGIAKEKIHFVGNTMVDTLFKHRHTARKSNLLSQLGLHAVSTRGAADEVSKAPPSYAVVTLHRPSNVDDRETFHGILEALLVLARDMSIFFPAHPRTMQRIKEFHLESYFTAPAALEQSEPPSTTIRLLKPLGYLDFLCLMSHAKLVLTDSGGLQEETTALGIPCVTLRHNTERPITVTQGTNVLAGTQKTVIIHHALCQLTQAVQLTRPRFWDGHAGERIIKILAAHDSIAS